MIEEVCCIIARHRALPYEQLILVFIPLVVAELSKLRRVVDGLVPVYMLHYILQ